MSIRQQDTPLLYFEMRPERAEETGPVKLPRTGKADNLVFIKSKLGYGQKAEDPADKIFSEILLAAFQHGVVEIMIGSFAKI